MTRQARLNNQQIHLKARKWAARIAFAFIFLLGAMAAFGATLMYLAFS